MNKIVNDIIGKKAAILAQAADEEIVISKKVLGLEIAVALLGGIVLGMLLSPRKKISYKIASNNRINAEEDENDEDNDERYEYDEEDDSECSAKNDCCTKKPGNLIKL